MKLELNSSHTLTAELSVGIVLKNLASSESTGCLKVTGDKIEFSVFLHHGKLLEIDCSAQSLSQLIYRLRQLGCNEAAKSVKITANTNPTPARSPLGIIQQELDRLVDREMLDLTLAIQLSTAVTKEFLESLLWLQTGSCQWQERESNAKTINKNTESKLDLSKLIEYYQQRLKIWQNYITIVQSPHQRPYLTQENLLEKPIVAGTLSSKALRQIAQLMRGISLRELSILLKQDELKVIKLLIPYLREQIFFLREPSSPFNQLPQIPEFNAVSNEVVSLDRN